MLYHCKMFSEGISPSLSPLLYRARKRCSKKYDTFLRALLVVLCVGACALLLCWVPSSRGIRLLVICAKYQPLCVGLWQLLAFVFLSPRLTFGESLRPANFTFTSTAVSVPAYGALKKRFGKNFRKNF